MKKIVVTASLLLIYSQALMSQAPKQIQARLVRTFYKGDFLEALDEAAIGLKNYSANSKDKVIIRVCSRDTLLEALGRAAGKPYLLPPILERYGFPSDRVYYATYSGCSPSRGTIAPTEFWLQPEGSVVIPVDEIVEADDINIEELETPDSAKSFDKGLITLVESLHRNPEAIALLVAFYINRPSRELVINAQRAESFLYKKGLPRNRYKRIIVPWYGMQDAGSPEPRYPTFLIVQKLRVKQ